MNILIYLYILPIADIFTVEEAIEKMGFGPFQILITVFSGLLWVRDITYMSFLHTWYIIYMYMLCISTQC
jgi:hypothetical protein